MLRLTGLDGVRHLARKKAELDRSSNKDVERAPGSALPVAYA